MQWSDKFATKIVFIDNQHKEIFELLNDLSQCCHDNTVNPEMVSNALLQLHLYSHRHFIAEEALMRKMQLDERHIHAHHMEHCSFIYDIERLSVYMETPDNLLELTEKLVSFISHWWCYHILGIDHSMSRQLIAIKKGKTAAEAYELTKKLKHDSIVMQLMLEAALQLWRAATERNHALEKEIARLKEQQPSS